MIEITEEEAQIFWTRIIERQQKEFKRKLKEKPRCLSLADAKKLGIPIGETIHFTFYAEKRRGAKKS